jgi:hypothetical protein
LEAKNKSLENLPQDPGHGGETYAQTDIFLQNPYTTSAMVMYQGPVEEAGELAPGEPETVTLNGVDMDIQVGILIIKWPVGYYSNGIIIERSVFIDFVILVAILFTQRDIDA